MVWGQAYGEVSSSAAHDPFAVAERDTRAMAASGWWPATPPQQRQNLLAGRMLGLPDGTWWLFGAWARWHRWNPGDDQWHLCPPPRLTLTRVSARPLPQGMPVPPVPPHLVPTGPDLAYEPPQALGFVDAGIRPEVTSQVRATLASAAALPAPDYPHGWGLFSTDVPSTVAATWGVMLWSASAPVFDTRMDAQLLSLWSPYRARPLPDADGPRWLTPPPLASLVGLYAERLRAGRVDAAVVVLRTMWAMAGALRDDPRFGARADALTAMLGAVLGNPALDYDALPYGDQAVVQQWLTRCPPPLAPGVRAEASAGEHFRNAYYDLALALTPVAGEPSQPGYVEPRHVAISLIAADLATVRQDVAAQVLARLDPEVRGTAQALLAHADHPFRRFWPENNRLPADMRDRLAETDPAVRRRLLGSMYAADLAWCRLGGGIPARPRGFPSPVAILAEILGPARATAAAPAEPVIPTPGLAPLAPQYPIDPMSAGHPAATPPAHQPPTGPPGQAPQWVSPAAPPRSGPPATEAWEGAAPLPSGTASSGPPGGGGGDGVAVEPGGPGADADSVIASPPSTSKQGGGSPGGFDESDGTAYDPLEVTMLDPAPLPFVPAGPMGPAAHAGQTPLVPAGPGAPGSPVPGGPGPHPDAAGSHVPDGPGPYDPIAAASRLAREAGPHAPGAPTPPGPGRHLPSGTDPYVPGGAAHPSAGRHVPGAAGPSVPDGAGPPAPGVPGSPVQGGAGPGVPGGAGKHATYIDRIGGTSVDALSIPVVPPRPVPPGPPPSPLGPPSPPAPPGPPRTRILGAPGAVPERPQTRIMSEPMFSGIGAPMPERVLHEIEPPPPAPMPKVVERFGIRFVSGPDDAATFLDRLAATAVRRMDAAGRAHAADPAAPGAAASPARVGRPDATHPVDHPDAADTADQTHRDSAGDSAYDAADGDPTHRDAAGDGGERGADGSAAGGDDAMGVTNDAAGDVAGPPTRPDPVAVLVVGEPHSGQRRLTRLVARTLAAVGVGDGSVRASESAELSGDPAEAIARVLRAGGPPLLFEGLDTAVLTAQDPSAVAAAVVAARASGAGAVVIATCAPKGHDRLAAEHPELVGMFEKVGLPEFGDVEARLALTHVLADERRVTIDRQGMSTVRADLPRMRGRGDLVSARLVEAYLDRAVARHVERAGVSRDRLVLGPGDFSGVAAEIEPSLRSPRDVEGFLRGLDEMIGLDEVKRTVRGLVAEARLSAEWVSKGLPPGNPSRHLMFLGSPGTGKATVAGLVGGAYAALNLLDSGHVVVCSARDLAAEDAVSAQVDHAAGGVLLIEDANLLDRVPDVVRALLRLMADRRDKFMVVCAARPEEMDGFLLANPGFRAEFGAIVEFREPTGRQLVQLFTRLAERDLYLLDEELRVELLERFGRMRRSPAFGHADAVRRLFEQTVARQATRLAGANVTAATVARLSVHDLPALMAHGGHENG